MSLTVTTPLAISSGPSTTTKRMPARSAYLNCLPSLPASITTSVGDAGIAQLRGEFEIGRQLRFVHLRDQHLDRAFRGAEQLGLAQLPEQPRRADRDADAGQMRLCIICRKIVVAPAGADRADLRMFVQRRFVDGAGVVVEAARDRQVDRVVRFRHAERLDQFQHFAQFGDALIERLAACPQAHRAWPAHRHDRCERICTKSRIFSPLPADRPKPSPVSVSRT